ncbi:MAG: DEAD/DEAH box helicase [Dehalococcoidia bacterium]
MPASFADLGLSADVLKALEDLGFEEPTPIQSQTIGPLLSGHDVIGQAQTGTGKTAAFAIPIVEQIEPKRRAVQALVLTPTRELAVQVAEHTHRIGRHRGVDVLPIYGGQSYARQIGGLRHGAQVVVGTPGRVMDHLRRETLDLADLRIVVLDEADEMLNMGFIEDVEWILDQAPQQRQIALFSATMPPRIANLAERYLTEPERISVSQERLTLPQTDQWFVEVPARAKLDALTRILDVEAPASAIIFCRTKREVDDLGESLAGRGYAVDTLHGDLNQIMRERVLRRFRDGQVEILVATDVAARGLDIAGVSHVINYDIPEDSEAYVHRIGRTGRAGRYGVAITFVTPREIRLLRFIERGIGKKIAPMRLPTVADVAARRIDALRETLRRTLLEDQYEPYLLLVESLSEEFAVVEIAAAAAKLAIEASRPLPVDLPLEGDGAGAEPGMTRLFLDVGRNGGVRPGDLVGAIANEADIPGRAIGAIDIYDTFSFVEVPNDRAEWVIEALSQATIKGLRVRASIARPDADPGRRPPRDAKRPPAKGAPAKGAPKPAAGKSAPKHQPAGGRREPSHRPPRPKARRS